MRPLCVLLGALLATSMIHAVDDPTTQELRRASRATTKGNNALETGNLSKAKQQYEKALTVVRDFPDAHLGLGHVAMRERKFQQGLASFERARDGYLEMSHILFIQEQKNYQDAQGKLVELRAQLSALEANMMNRQAAAEQSATTNNPDEMQRKLFGSDSGDQAAISRLESQIFQLENLQRPDDSAPDRVPARIHFFIGNALMNLNRTDEAIAAWETCVREEPGFALVYNNLAVAYFRARRFEDAERAIAEAEKRDVTVHPQFKSDLARAKGNAGAASTAEAN